MLLLILIFEELASLFNEAIAGVVTVVPTLTAMQAPDQPLPLHLLHLVSLLPSPLEGAFRNLVIVPMQPILHLLNLMKARVVVQVVEAMASMVTVLSYAMRMVKVFASLVLLAGLVMIRLLLQGMNKAPCLTALA